MNWFKSVCFLLTFFIISCKSDHNSACDFELNGTLSAVYHAEFLNIYSIDDSSHSVTIKNIEGDSSIYLISPNSKDQCVNALTPTLKKIVVFSATHVYMLDTLDVLDRLIGFSKSEYTSNQTLLNAIDNGQVKLFGDFETCDLEALIMSGAELVIISGGSQNRKKIDQLQNAGILVMQNFEWMEGTPLARAEWIKFFGALVGKLDLANSIFDGIKTNYLNLVQKAQNDSMKMDNFIYGFGGNSGWYIPGRKSFMAQLFQDARISYPWLENDAKGSIQISFESIALQSKDAEIWISPGYSSKDDLLSTDDRFSEFYALTHGSIYNYDKRIGPNGTSEFWEKSVLRCDLLLSDFIQMKQQVADSLYFFRKLD